jgi:hypothetical protein
LNSSREFVRSQNFLGASYVLSILEDHRRMVANISPTQLYPGSDLPAAQTFDAVRITKGCGVRQSKFTPLEEVQRMTRPVCVNRGMRGVR